MAEDVAVGMPVRVVTDRKVADQNWRDRVGHVWGEFRRGHVADWVLVALGGDGNTVLVGFAPAELEPAS